MNSLRDKIHKTSFYDKKMVPYQKVFLHIQFFLFSPLQENLLGNINPRNYLYEMLERENS